MKFREKYGDDVFEKFTSKTNRSKSQTEELFQLINDKILIPFSCNADINLLCELEEKLKNNFLFYSPASVEEINIVLKMTNSLKVMDLNEFKNKYYDFYQIRENKGQQLTYLSYEI